MGSWLEHTGLVLLTPFSPLFIGLYADSLQDLKYNLKVENYVKLMISIMIIINVIGVVVVIIVIIEKDVFVLSRA